MSTGTVVLASMPWTTVRAPSIQLGTITAILDRAGVPVRAAHLYVDFFDLVTERLPDAFADVDDFEQCGWLFGEWVFAVPPFRTIDHSAFRAAFEPQFGPLALDRAFAVRDLVPDFLDKCAEDVLAGDPAVVGFSSTFSQTTASLALARELKDRRSDLRVVVGGSNCEGPMGAAMHRLFPWIDIVVRGEAEEIVPGLFRELIDRSPVTPRPGLCIREGTDTHVVPEDRPRVSMSQVPVPAYEDYFDRVRHSALKASRLWLPFETSRGCWWGLKHLCTFCAANGQTVTFRSKPADVAVSQLMELTRRYDRPDVWFVDNILDESYLRTVFPLLRDRDEKVSMFVESKAHVSRHNMEVLRDAGVVMAQVGVESLSTPILKIMDKGTTAIQNIRMLKWCAELGIKVFWNIIYGFPGEPPEEYRRIADVVPSLVHLEPPNPPVPLRLDRFSVYHNDPERFGIDIEGPLPINAAIHVDKDPGDVLDLQYFFNFRYADGRVPDDYVRPLANACARWRETWRENYCQLFLRSGENDAVTTIVDRRTTCTPSAYRLDALDSAAYRACDAGGNVRHVWDRLSDDQRRGTTVEGLTAILDDMVAHRLMFEDNGVYLALAVSPSGGYQPRSVPFGQLHSMTDARVS